MSFRRAGMIFTSFIRLSPARWRSAVCRGLLLVTGALTLVLMWALPTVAQDWDSASYYVSQPNPYIFPDSCADPAWRSLASRSRWYSYAAPTRTRVPILTFRIDNYGLDPAGDSLELLRIHSRTDFGQVIKRIHVYRDMNGVSDASAYLDADDILLDSADVLPLVFVYGDSVDLPVRSSPGTYIPPNSTAWFHLAVDLNPAILGDPHLNGLGIGVDIQALNVGMWQKGNLRFGPPSGYYSLICSIGLNGYPIVVDNLTVECASYGFEHTDSPCPNSCDGGLDVISPGDSLLIMLNVVATSSDGTDTNATGWPRVFIREFSGTSAGVIMKRHSAGAYSYPDSTGAGDWLNLLSGGAVNRPLDTAAGSVWLVFETNDAAGNLGRCSTLVIDPIDTRKPAVAGRPRGFTLSNDVNLNGVVNPGDAITLLADMSTEPIGEICTVTATLYGWYSSPYKMTLTDVGGNRVFSAVHTVGPGSLTALAGTQKVQIIVSDNACNSDSLLATLAAAVEIVLPDVIWVDTAGSDATGDGTMAKPFRTIPYAMGFVEAGKTVMVRPGLYEGPIIFPDDRTARLVSEQGPFVTTIAGTKSSADPVVTMAVGSLADSTVLDGFTIRDNSLSVICAGCAGAVNVAYPTRATIINNIITGNDASSGPGGIAFYGTGGLIANNWIVNNIGGGGGAAGALLVRDDATVKIVNNTIVGNADLSGSAAAGLRLIDINADGQTNILTFDNNIIAFNSPGSGFVASTLAPGGVAAARNNLYYNNGDGNVCPVSVSNCGWLFADPAFHDVQTGDYHLTCASPARGAGRVLSVPDSLRHDIDRNESRTTAGKVDIGADQFYDSDKHAIFYPADTTGCATGAAPFTVFFANYSACIDENWLWTFGDGGSSTVKNPSHAYSTAGDHTVRLVAWGEKDADTVTGTVHVVAPVTAEFSAPTTAGCKPLSVTFTATPVNASLRYVWDFGDGDIDSSGAVVTHQYDSAGTWTVQLRVRSVCGTATVIKPGYITVKPPPVVTITSDWVDPPPGPVCNPHTVKFGYTSDQPLISFAWDFGDHKFSSDSTPTHTYADADTFSVQLIATSVCGTTPAVRRDYIKLVPRPTAAVSVVPAFVCAGQATVRCSAAVTGQYSSAQWHFGDGGSVDVAIAEHAYSAIGYYHPLFVFSHACGTDTVRPADSIAVGDRPAAAFTVVPDSGYEPFTAAFTDQSANIPAGWQWEFGDEATSTLQNPTHRYSTGVHDAFLVATNPCGADISANRRIVVGGFTATIVDSTGTSGDTIFYTARVDTLVIPYDHTVTLSGRLTTSPRRGAMSFRFSPASGVPPFTAVMRAIPSRDLATGDYTVEFAATDSARTDDVHAPIKKIATRTLHYVARPLLAIEPFPLAMDSTPVGFPISKTVTLTNSSTIAEAQTLVIQTPTTSGAPFDIPTGSGATLVPQQRLTWTVTFNPFQRRDYTGWIRVRSDDPADTDDTIPVSGRGIGEQVPPRVAATDPAPGAEIAIDEDLRFEFTEAMVSVPLDTILAVQSKRANAPVPGQARLSGSALDFSPDHWFRPDDTITVLLRALVTDTSGNRLDGDSNGIEDGPPRDDYRLVFVTGPGVHPGDADRSGRIDEADLLPLGRFYGLTGPPWPHVYPGLTLQPALSWIPRAATYANTDGNRRIDSLDICAIADFFDRDTGLAKVHGEAWSAETKQWSTSILDALIAGLEDCPGEPGGRAALRVVLEDARSGRSGAVPRDFALDQNYPNPFNPATIITYSLPAKAAVRLEVFDILGRRVAVLVDREQEVGHHRTLWDGRDDSGRPVATGIYFYRLATPHFQQARKMVLLK